MPKITFNSKAVIDATKKRKTNAFLKDIGGLNSKTLMPSGKLMSRKEILTTLNLNPNTPYDAWLAIVACGINASALMPKDAKTLVNNKIIDSGFLRTVRVR